MEVVGVLLLFSLALFYRETAAASCGTDGPVTLARDCIEFTLITDDSPSSLNCTYDDVRSLQTSVRVQYRGAVDATWTTISVSDIETVKCRSTSCNNTAVVDQYYGITRGYTTMRAYFQNFQVGNGEGIQLRFIQFKHGGGYCDCWGLACDLLLINSSGNIVKSITPSCLGDDKGEALQCVDSASVERGIVIKFGNDLDPDFSDPSGNDTINNTATHPELECLQEIDVFRAPPVQLTTSVQVNTDCENQSYVEVRFTYELISLDSFDEGLEMSFSYLNSNKRQTRWIPIWYYSSHEPEDRGRSVGHEDTITLGNITDGQITLRGYTVNFTVAENMTDNEAMIRLCGANVFGRDTEDELFKWRFRWLQTAAQDDSNDTDGDVIRIYNIHIQAVLNGTTDSEIPLFDNTTSLSQRSWNEQRNVRFAENETVLEFYSDYSVRSPNITSREISTVCLAGVTHIHYTLITDSYYNSTNPQLQYRRSNGDWINLTQIQKNMKVVCNQTENLSKFRMESFVVEIPAFTFRDCFSDHRIRFNQSEHFCDCLAVVNLRVTLASGQTKTLRNECGNNINFGGLFCLDDESSLDSIAGFCEDSDCIPLKFISRLESNPFYDTNADDDSDLLKRLTMLFGSVGERINFPALASSFRSIIREFDEDFEFEPVDSKSIFSNVSQWLDHAKNNFVNGNTAPMDYVAGSTILFVLEDIALNHHPASSLMGVQTDNIVLGVKQMHTSTTDEKFNMSLIEDENAEIHIPREVISGQEADEQVRVASFLHRNMSGLLPERLGRIEDFMRKKDDADETIFRLASPVISASLQCDNCTIDNLTDPVEVSFSHTEYDMALLRNDSWDTSVMCVFWKFEQNQNGNLVSGQWSPFGCNTTFTENSTLCSCNHLTNFAILLSARPLDFSKAQSLSLQITGYIGVIVSLVAMAATIVVFICLKPLRTMRNYIHIQLCVSLGIAQIIFVAGVEPHLGEGQLVPVGCRLVAVLLHYWFLVSFMWMLMEGVVLYVALVRVFVKYHARYIAAFTIASYGLPLLYVGALTVPLGFVRTDDYRQNETYDYGYEQACYLNPTTHFIWSIIAPVILIFIANVGFFVMAIVIMYRHQKRQHTEKKSHIVRHWIKATISLTVVMGITWIIGILVIEVKALFALAYIFTIFVAFQGLFIFVIFVLLSKQVRENYVKWWKAKVAESDFLSKHFGTKTFNLGTDLSGQQRPKKINSIDKSASNIMFSKEKRRSNTMELGGNYSDCVQGSLSYSEANGFEKEIDDKVQCNKTTDPSSYTYDVTYIPS